MLKRISLLIIFLIFSRLVIFAESDLSGYYENRFFLIFNTLKKDQGDNKILTGDYNRLRLKLKATPIEKVRINLAVDFFSIYGSLMTPAGVNDNPSTEEINSTEQINIDRVYADIFFLNDRFLIYYLAPACEWYILCQDTLLSIVQ